MSDDSKIIDLFFCRNEKAIAELSSKYGAICSKLSKNILKNDLDVQECVNDSYLAVWNTVPPQKPNPLKAYLLRIVRNISIAKYRSNTSKKRNSYYDLSLDELQLSLTNSVTVESEIDFMELSLHINRFLEELDKESRVMFVKRYWFCESITNLAEQYNTNNHNVTVKLSRIREKLKNYLIKEDFEL